MIFFALEIAEAANWKAALYSIRQMYVFLTIMALQKIFFLIFAICLRVDFIVIAFHQFLHIKIAEVELSIDTKVRI